jgi:transcriptional regulator with XRE-family HTH domain
LHIRFKQGIFNKGEEKKMEKTEEITLGTVLRQKRKERNLTLQKAADGIGICFQALWQMEQVDRFRRTATMENLEKFAKFYSLDMIELIKLNFRNTREYKVYKDNLRYYRKKALEISKG